MWLFTSDDIQRLNSTFGRSNNLKSHALPVIGI